MPRYAVLGAITFHINIAFYAPGIESPVAVGIFGLRACVRAIYFNVVN